MTRERINGGLGVIITDEDLIEKIVTVVNDKFPCKDGIEWSKWDLCDNYHINAVYVDQTSTIGVYVNGSFNSVCNYVDSGMIIWAKHDVYMSRLAYIERQDMVDELKNTLSEWLDDDDINTIDFDNNAGLIVYTEYN